MDAFGVAVTVTAGLVLNSVKVPPVPDLVLVVKEYEVVEITAGAVIKLLGPMPYVKSNPFAVPALQVKPIVIVQGPVPDILGVPTVAVPTVDTLILLADGVVHPAGIT